MIFNLAVRELRNHWKLSLLFVVNLSFGLTGFVGLDLFKTSVEASLAENAKQILSADMALSVRRIFSDNEVKQVLEAVGDAQSSRLKEFFSMVRSDDESRLVQVKVIDEKFPFYGEVKLESGQLIKNGNNIKPGEIWVYPELLIQLGIKVGDSIRLGEADFRIADVVEQDIAQGFRFASMAPRIYLGHSDLEKTGLIAKGSTISDALLIKINSDTDAGLVAQSLEKKIDDPAVQITTAEEASQDTSRTLKYLTDYLGLSALVGLFLSLIGGLYLFRVFVNKKMKSIAISNALGLPLRKSVLITVIQIIVLTLFSTFLTLIIARLSVPLLNKSLSMFSPIPFNIQISLRPVLQAFIIAAVGCISFFIPVLYSMMQTTPLALLRDRYSQEIKIHWKVYALFLLPLGILWLLSVWQSRSYKVASYFLLGLFGCAIVLILISLILIWFLKKFTQRGSWPFRQAMLSLTRHSVRTISVIAALGLGTLLITMVPQVKSSIQNDLKKPGENILPSYFMFDIQDEQIEGVQKLAANQNLKLANVSPMVRARILKVNGLPFEKAKKSDIPVTREEENEMRFRNRGFNLSYREELTPSEKIVEGKMWTGRFDPKKQKRPWISVEPWFAERLKFKIGDILLFDVQGVEIEGEIANFRSVRWNSFQPNFFVQFQPGVLEEAPKTFLASLPAVPLETGIQFQRALVKKYPNVSMVDVHRAIDKIFDTIDKMSWSLELMAGLCFFVGLVVLFSISTQQMNERAIQFALLKTLGAKLSKLNLSYAYEFFVLGFVSSVTGGLLSVMMSVIISKYVFETPLHFQIGSPLIGIAVVSVLTMLTALLSAVRSLKMPPQQVFQDMN